MEGMVQKEDIVKTRDDGGGNFKWDRWCRKEGIIKGRDNAQGGHYNRQKGGMM